MSTKVYVYHEYQDDLPYTDEIIRLFRNRQDGIAFLKQRVEKEYGMSWEDAEKRILNEDKFNTFTEDYVSAESADLYAHIFFILEPVEIQE